MSQELKDHLAERLKHAKSAYANDLRAMSHELLASSPGGAARSPYDYTYEVVFVNLRVARRLRGTPVEDQQPEGWVTAPEDFKDKDRAIEKFESSMDAVLEAWEALPPEKVNECPPGTEWKYANMASLIATHVMYHDAQLNLVQSMAGDVEVHW